MSKIETKMQKMFKGYTNYSTEEYKKIWESSIIVVDTNILLNLYRYSEDTRKEIIAVLKSLKKRLWIPYQVGKEYFNNKNNVISDSYNDYSKLNSELIEAIENAEKVVNKKKNNYLKCKNEILKVLETTSDKISELLEEEKRKKEPQFEDNDIEKQIIKLFDNSIGAPFSDEELILLREEGKRRFENKIPPGYKDDKKEENGDYYIFYSMIKKSKEENKDVIFITDDVKEDWFNEINGEKHGGRYELLDEFYKETGNLLLIYTSDGFVRAYGKNVEKIESEKFIDELINVRINYTSDIKMDEYKKENEIINKLKLYRNYFINIDDVVDKNELFDGLFETLRETRVPFQYVFDIRKFMKKYEEDKKNGRSSRALKVIIHKINTIISYLNSEERLDEESNEKMKNKTKKEFEKQLVELDLCKNEKDAENLLVEINDTVKRYWGWYSLTEINSNIRNRIIRMIQVLENAKESFESFKEYRHQIRILIERILEEMNEE